jgi:hypothetical protein
MISDKPFDGIYTHIVDVPVDQHAIKLKKLGFVLEIEDTLRKHDYVYVIDSDCIMIKDIHVSEILPDGIDYTVCAAHPWQTTGSNSWLLEQNKESLAYLDNANTYFQSCIWGGHTEMTLGVLNQIDQWIQEDIRKNVRRAIWHEESYFNKYLNGRKTKILDKTYVFPSDCYLKEKSIYKIKMVHFNYGSSDCDLSIIDHD